MNFKHPELIPLFFLVPIILGFFVYLFNKQKKILSQFIHSSKLKELFPQRSNFTQILRYALLAFAVIMLLIALVSPRWGFDWKEVETKGANILVALDISKSMLADDIKPTRLSRAKFEINKLIDKLQGDRLGLIIFSGDAYLQSPLTHDYLMIKDWLTAIDTNAISTPGTSIKAAIQTAMDAFEHLESESKALIVISDGEEHDDKTVDLARSAKNAGLKIFSIGVGTKKGAPIKTSNGLLKDSGSVVISKLDDRLLKEIADASDGYYVRSTTGDFHLEQLYFDQIKGKLNSELLKSGKTKQWKETFQIFVSLALVALLLEFFMTVNFGVLAVLKKIKTKLFNTRKKSILNIFLLALVWNFINGASVSASVLDPRVWSGDIDLRKADFGSAREKYIQAQIADPHDSRLNYNLGICHYREGNYSAAVNSFMQSVNDSSSPHLTQQALYNLGNTQFMAEDFESAVSAYEEALKISPDDEDTKHNLQLAKKRLQQQQQENQDEKKDDQNQDNNEDQENQDDQNQDKDQKDNDQNEDQQNKDQQQNEQQRQQQREKERQQELSREQLKQLLNQLQEAKPQEVMQQQGKKAGDQEAKLLKPW